MLLLFGVGCAGVELGHCKAPDVSQTILHSEFGGCPNPPTHGGTAELTSGQYLCFKGAVVVETPL